MRCNAVESCKERVDGRPDQVEVRRALGVMAGSSQRQKRGFATVGVREDSVCPHPGQQQVSSP